MLKDILTIAKKELKSCFSDKVILAQILVLPFIIVFGYSMLMSISGNNQNETDSKDYNAYYINAPIEMTNGLSELGISSTTLEIDTIKKQIAKKDCDLLVVFPIGFTITNMGELNLSDIQIWYNSENTDSARLYNTTVNFLNTFQPSVFTINANTDYNYDFGDEHYGFKKFIGSLLPAIIFMAVYMVCTNLSAESIAGDKERGFLNTMLITPIKRMSIAVGKSICIFIAAIIGGISAFIGMAVSLPSLAESIGATDSISYSFSEYLLLFGVTVTAIFIIAGLLFIISTLAKDVKQSTSLASPIMLILMLASMLRTVESFDKIIDKLDLINAFIPAWNTMVVMEDIIVCDYSFRFVLITCIINIVFAGISLIIIGKLFENEKIINK